MALVFDQVMIPLCGMNIFKVVVVMYFAVVCCIIWVYEEAFYWPVMLTLTMSESTGHSSLMQSSDIEDF